MLKIKGENVRNSLGYYADYVLEDDTELWEQDWNGELYTQGWKETNTKTMYRPVYVKENNEFKIIGFEEV